MHPKIYDEEGQALRVLAATVALPNCIVELGSYTGKSTACLAVGSAEGAGARIYAIDLWLQGARDADGFRRILPAEEPNQSRGGEFSVQTWKYFQARMARWDTQHLVVPITGATQDEAEGFTDPIGLLFIDAEHSYRAVKRDFAMWTPKVVAGGTVCLHDYHRNSSTKQGIKQVVDEQDEWAVIKVVRSMAVLNRRQEGAREC
jgi:predicted O-methyltransferase YrrM